MQSETWCEFFLKKNNTGLKIKWMDKPAKWGHPILVISGSLQGILYMGIRWSLDPHILSNFAIHRHVLCFQTKKS